jgi:hypothetical protein
VPENLASRRRSSRPLAPQRSGVVASLHPLGQMPLRFYGANICSNTRRGERVKSCDDTFSNATGKRDPDGLMKRWGPQAVHSPAYGPEVAEPGDFRTPGLLHAMQPHCRRVRAYSPNGMNVHSCRVPAVMHSPRQSWSGS